MADAVRLIESALLRIERRSIGIAILRLRTPEATLLDDLGSRLGVTWPVTPNTSAAGAGKVVLWMGPGEWMIVHPPGETIRASIKDVCAPRLHLLTDLTDGFHAYGLMGPAVVDILAKGVSLDLHQRAFGPARCAQTVLAGAPVVVHRPGHDNALTLFVDSSQAAWLEAWMIDAALELSQPTGADPLCPNGGPDHND